MTDATPGDADEAELRDQVRGQFEFQGAGCVLLGSPLWGEMCERLAADVAAGGPAWELVAHRAHLRFGLALPLRLLGGAHRLALTGQAPALAAQLPSCGATSTDADATWRALIELITAAPPALIEALDLQVQTNEVGRSAALALGLARIAERSPAAHTLAEIGSSAGLNLRLDRFAYRAAGTLLAGDDTSPVEITDVWDTDPRLAALDSMRIDRRVGCDVAPVDPTTDEGALRLRSFVWPDQATRRARLDGAIDVARRNPASIDASGALPWLTALLSAPRAGGIVVMHSIMWQYVDKPDRSAVTQAIEAAGADASDDRPVAWLAYEPDRVVEGRAALTLRAWPGDGEPEQLAVGGFHGEWVAVGS